MFPCASQVLEVSHIPLFMALHHASFSWFIYLAATGLCCSMCDLVIFSLHWGLWDFFFFFWLQHVGSFSCSMRNLLSCGMWALELQHMNSLIVTCGTYFPDQELNSGPWHWEHGVLASGPLGKSPTFIFVATSISLILTFLPLFYKNSCDYKAQSL